MQVCLGHLLTPQAQTQESSTAPRLSFVDANSSRVRLVRRALGPSECDDLIAAANQLGFSAPEMFDARDRVCERIHTVDPSLSMPMMERLAAFLPEIVVVDGARWRLSRFTHHWRFVRYFQGGHFAPHYDGSKMLPWHEMSMFTVQIYLNSQELDFTGGDTRFYMDFMPEHQASHKIIDGQSRRAFTETESLQPTHTVKPHAGDVLVFDHGGQSVFHDGEPVRSGCKYILRGDLLYVAVEEDRPVLEIPVLPPELRKWCNKTAADFGTRDFIGQVWTCECSKDKHGSGCCKHGIDSWQDDHSVPSTSIACADIDGTARECKRRVCILLSGKRASGKDFVASVLRPSLEAAGLSTVQCAMGSINKKAYAEKAGIDAARLEKDREFKELHRVAMVEHHKARNAEDPEWCLKQVWSEAEYAGAAVLLLTDFRTRRDHRWFSDQCGHERSLICLRIEASNEARSARGWQFDMVKDSLYSEVDLDAFSGWDACLDNSGDWTTGLVDEWVKYTVVPRVLSSIGCTSSSK